MIRFDKVTFAYNDEEPLLRDFSCRFKAGQCSVLIGPSGCGKSTLIRLVTGLEQASAGLVFFQDEAVTAATIGHIRRRLGYVIQEGGLFPNLTVLQNIGLAARARGGEAGPEDVRRLAALTHLNEALLDRYPRELSGGQRQRVSLMRALTGKPEVLMLDEPLGALDPMIRAGVQQTLKELIGALGLTVVMVTHDLAEAALFADEIFLMHKGAIVQQGPVGQLLHQPANEFVRRFVNSQRGVEA